MFAFENLHDAAFGAATGAAPFDSRQHMVTVHCIAETVWPDEEVAFDPLDRLIRHDKAITISVSDNPAGD
jgi:hypothetical protein